MIKPLNSSLVENFNNIENPLRRKRKFSDMMNNQISFPQGILNNNLYYTNNNLEQISENLFLENEFHTQNKFEIKKRKINNNNYFGKDFLITIEKDFKDLKIQKFENSNDLRLHFENSFDNEINNKSSVSHLKFSSNVNEEENEKKIKGLLGKKSKYEEEELKSLNINENNKFQNNCNSVNNREYLKKEKNEKINFDYLLEEEELKSNNNENNFNKKNYYEFKKEKFDKENYLNFKNELEESKINIYNFYENAENLKNQNYEKNNNQSFIDYGIDIDMSDFKNQPNNQNFFNSELEDLETINTTRNSNFDDLSLSFITEYTNKNVSGNIINNAIQSEKLMMKLFDVCNPALQPNEK